MTRRDCLITALALGLLWGSVVLLAWAEETGRIHTHLMHATAPPVDASRLYP